MLYGIFSGQTLLMKKLIAAFGLILFTNLTFGQETKYVNTEELNIRTGAGTKYEVTGKASQGDKVIVISTQGKWSEIELNNGTKGYVSSKFLSDSSNSTSSSSSKKGAWAGYLIVIGFILYGLNKVFNFFGGSSNSRSPSLSQPRTESSPQSSTSSYKPKIKPLRGKTTDIFKLFIRNLSQMDRFRRSRKSSICCNTLKHSSNPTSELQILFFYMQGILLKKYQ
jgi:uncharacterized protein YgiM (DUF1202 family)